MQRTEIGRHKDPGLFEQLTETLGALGCFRGVSAPVVSHLLELGTLVDLEAGETLIHEGDSATAEIYLLVHGSLIVQSKAVFIARFNQPGDIVGEVAALMSAKRSADVIAESAARVIALQPQLIKQPQHTEVAAVIHRIVSESVSNKMTGDWAQY